MTIKRRPSYLHIPDEKLVEDLRRVARRLKQLCLSQREYDPLGRYNHQVMARRFGSWGKAIDLASLRKGVEQGIDVDALMYNIVAVWIKLGRRPTISEMRRPLSKFSVRPYQDRFRSWRKAMKFFFEWLRSRDLPEGVRVQPQPAAGAIVIRAEEQDAVCRMLDHRTRRKPSLRQRFRVMMRDGFRCCACGRSPATDREVQLQVDHVKPWSKGGETIDSNLQTLCWDCNQGKRDSHPRQPRGRC